MFTKQLNILDGRFPVLACCRSSLAAAGRLLIDVFSGGGKLLVCGNGGSAADAEHIVGELMKGFVKRRSVSAADRDRLAGVDADLGVFLAGSLQGALPAIALTAQISLSTAVANDNGGDLPFAQQVWGYGQRDDVLWAISTSGNSRSVALAAVAAKAKGMRVLGMTGAGGGKLAQLADVCIQAPADETYQVQELHVAIYHMLCLSVEEHFFQV